MVWFQEPDISLGLVIWLMFLHLIADFFLQTTWVAQNKSKSWSALIIHVDIYFLVFLFGTLSLPYALLNAGIHLVVDYFTSRLNSRLYQYSDKHWFFCGIGVDQFIHLVCLTMTVGVL